MRAAFRRRIGSGLVAAHCAIATTVPASAAPALDRVTEIQGAVLVPDHERPDVFYLAPKPIRIALRSSGAPALGLRLTYYFGSELRGDAGEEDISWTLSVDLERENYSHGERDAILAALARETDWVGELVLRSLPIVSTPMSIVYTPIAENGESVAAVIISDGYVADEEEDGSGDESGEAVDSFGSNSYWRTRRLNYSLSPEDGQIMRRAFEENGAVMSITYAHQVNGVVREEGAMGEAGAGDSLIDAPKTEWVETTRLFGADALRVEIDAQAHPDFLTIVDLNSRAPPGYPILSFICSDFVLDPEDWLFDAKTISVEAMGVAGRPVRNEIDFPLDDPEISLQGATFGYAVRLDRPFRYRVTVYPVDEDSYQTRWFEVSRWGPPINVSGGYDQSDRAGLENGEIE